MLPNVAALNAALNKEWRSISLDTPILWNQLKTVDHTCLLKRGICTARLPLIRCSLQLERSRSLPLSIDATSLDCRMENGDSFSTACRCQFSTLRICAFECERWKELTFDINMMSALDFKSILPIQPRFPVLEILDFDEGCSFDMAGEWMSLFGNMPSDALPSLTSLTLARSECDINAPNFPWSRLSYLTLECFVGDGVALVQLLSSCSNLLSLSILGRLDYHRLASLDPYLPSITTLNKLQDLIFLFLFNLDQDTPSIPLDILPLFKAPNLRSLKLSHLTEGDLSTLVDFLARSGSSLLTEVQLPFRETYAYDPLLKLLPNLQTLLLHSGIADPDSVTLEDCDGLLKVLIHEEGSPCYAPKLEYLSFEDLQFDPVLMARVIRSRNTLPASAQDKAHAPLTLFELGFQQRSSSGSESDRDEEDESDQSDSLAEFYVDIIETCLATSNIQCPCEVTISNSFFIR
jgi:hypothetical protein